MTSSRRDRFAARRSLIHERDLHVPTLQCVGVEDGDDGLDREEPRPAAGEPWLKLAQASRATIGACFGLVVAGNGVLQI